MAVSVGSLLVSLGLDSGEFKSGMTAAEKQFRRSVRDIEKSADRLRDIGTKLSVAITAPLAALGVASLKAASDAAELQSAFNQTFGSMSQDMNKWAETTGNAMGRSTEEIQQAANTFGIFFNQAAKSRGEAAKLAQQFAVLSQDLSSFFNVDPTTAMEKLRSGLSGEAEPLRDFGVFLNEAAVAAKAVELGFAKSKKEISDQAKIMARAAIIMDATKNAQGDVARTADGTANRVRAARAAFEELQVAIGQKLIPALTPLVTGLTNVLNGFNSLTPGVQRAIVYVGALAAAAGPVSLVISGITRALGPFVAGIRLATVTVAGAGVATTTFGTALAVLRTSLITLVATLGPYAVALGAVAGVIYLVSRRSEQAAATSATYRDQQERLNQVQQRGTSIAEQLASATGQARKEAIANANALREETKQYLANARAAAQAARAKLASVQAQNLEDLQQSTRVLRGVGGGNDPVLTQSRVNRTREAGARQEIMRLEQQAGGFAKEIYRLEQIINAPAPTVSVPEVEAAKPSREKAERSGPSAADIERRFQDELDSYRAQVASAESRMATSAEERAELELRGVESARRQTIRAIEADEDYSQAQKDRLKVAVENLAAAEREAIEFQRAADIERERADMEQVAFDSQREQLALQADVADTQAERKRLALEILKLEQDYRRNQLEMVLASETASDAEKARAQAILDSLDAIDAGERASVSRGNETEIERYLRELNKSPEQITEELGEIKIDGLKALEDGLLAAAMGVKSLKESFHDMAQQILADLLRLAIKQSIIRMLAGLAFGGSGAGPTDLLAGTPYGGSSGGMFGLPVKIPGFAAGTRFAPGGMALVGERGPELVNLPRGSQVIPNHELRDLSSGSSVQIAFHNDFRGAAPEAVARIDARLDQMQRELPSTIVSTMQDARSRFIWRD